MSDYFKLNLPTSCRLYKTVNGEVSTRLYTGKEEKIISTITKANFERKIIELLKSVMKGIDPAEMTLGDRLYVLMYLSINSYGSKLPVKITCEHCLLHSDVEIDLVKMENTPLSEEYKEPYELSLSSGAKVFLKLLRVSDELNVSEYENRLRDMGTKDFSTVLYRFALSLIDDSKNVKEKELFLEALPAKDMARIRTFQEKYYHGPSMKLPYSCDKCGGTGEMPVPFRLELLFPQGEDLTRRFGSTV